MPSTVNSTGTGYVGRRNVETRVDTCEFCGHQATIRSYDTWHCIVILFAVPLIPLGRRRIINECSRCRRHRWLPLSRWEKAKAEAVAQAGAKAAVAPHDPKAAIEALETYMAFRRAPEADALAEQMVAAFPNDAEVLFHVAQWHVDRGRSDEAFECLERALAANPNHLGARRVLAMRRAEAGDLDGARHLAEPFVEPGPLHDPQVLIVLARAYQAQGRHEETLDLSQAALRGTPAIQRDKAFRKLVKASEAALIRETSILPKRRLGHRGRGALAVLGVAAAVVVALGLLLKGHRTLHVVNGLPQAVEVILDGGSPLRVSAGEHLTLTVAEGDHTARIQSEGAELEQVDFRLPKRFLGLGGQKSLYILNPRGAATFLHGTYVYVSGPATRDENTYEIRFGESFLAFEDVEFRLTEVPDQVRMEGNRSIRRGVTRLEGPPVDLLNAFHETGASGRTVDFAEHHLALNPADEALLLQYAQLVSQTDAGLERGRAFLGKRLTDRPVNIPWHRMYQTMGRVGAAYDATVAEYDRLLAAAPGDSALLYLRARLSPTCSAAAPLYERALAADPKNAYAHLGLAFCHFSRGDFALAKPLLEEGMRLKPTEPAFEGQLYNVRLALKEYPALLAETRARLSASPLDPAAHVRLLELLLLSGAADEAAAAQTRHEQTVRAQAASVADQYLPLARFTYLYLRGDFAATLAEAQKNDDPQNQSTCGFRAALATGDMDAAEQHIPRMPQGLSAAEHLMVSIGWHLAGNAARADEWRTRALAKFRIGGEERAVADLLGRPDATVAEAMDLSLEPDDKAVVLLALAVRRPDLRPDVLDRAAAFNYGLGARGAFIRRAIKALRVAPAGRE